MEHDLRQKSFSLQVGMDMILMFFLFFSRKFLGTFYEEKVSKQDYLLSRHKYCG